VHDFGRVKRDLARAVVESLYASVEGSTDSELLFYLALTFGLEKDPPIQMTIGTPDGKSVWGSIQPSV
jgi:hypothetical protein